MKKIFILLWVVMVYLSLFAEGNPKDQHTCADYGDLPNEFIPALFDHLEEADNDDDSGYSKEFLQEHGGRAGKLVYQYQNNGLESDWTYGTMCSGTLIGQNYFITAGHCATTKDVYGNDIKIVGVLFGYQKADLEDNDDDEYGDDDNEISDDDSDVTGYPRVSLKGYLDKNGKYRRYGEEVPDMDIYPDFDRHPAYFPIKPGCKSNNDGSLEHGWKYICPNKEEDNDEDEENDGDIEYDDSDEDAVLAPEIEWTDGTSSQKIGKIDYAIYKLEKNKQEDWPAEAKDPWPWESDNNQSLRITLDTDLVTPWILPDNTNGARGWARVNTAVLQPNSPLNIIGSPEVARIYDGKDYHLGVKVVNAGNVVDGKAKRLAYSFYEDVLIFEKADIMIGHSGSSVIDNSGRVAGVVSWIGCWPGGNGWKPDNIIRATSSSEAQNYAAPMWKICRASQIVKNAALDMDCNGRIDWLDLKDTYIRFHIANIIVDINGLLIDRLGIHPIPLDLKNYRYDSTQQKVITETKELPANTYQVAWSDNGDFFYVAIHNNSVYLFKNGTALGEISNYPALNGSSTLVKGNDIYLAGGYVAGGIQYLSNGNQNNSGNTVQLITKISSDGQNGYNFSGVATIPANLEDIRIFALGNDIYVSGNTTTNFVVYKLVSDNQSEFGYSLSLVSDTTQPVRKDYNLTASDGKIIVSGGATDYISTVLNIEEGNPYPEGFAVYNSIIMLEPAVSNNWITVAENINDKIIMFSVTAIDNGNLVIVNPFITVGNSMQKFVLNLSDIPINNETIRVSFESHPLMFCLGESDNTLAGGLGTSGECVPFTHPWYNSFSAGATVYSLSGKGERLYVGTNNAIKVYDISDPISPVLVSSFPTSSRVNDLEVYGDTLFAATNSGLYKLDASNDTLTQTLFVSTFLNSQYKVEVYNGKLYVGDDNGIKVRDLETMSVLTSVNNGSVLDFAIENEEIGLYKDALFSPVEIRDAETLALKANEFFGCFEIEVGSSFGRFYLSCDDEIYRFEDDGDGGISFTELSGDIRELQDVYTFDGYTYLYDENTIWISTSNDVPALCGNGIVEGDEVCDGGQIDCSELDSSYVSGTATCNSTCDGYNTNNCSDDGW